MSEKWEPEWSKTITDLRSQLAAKDAEIERLTRGHLPCHELAQALTARAEKAERKLDEAQARVRVLEEQAPLDAYELLDAAEARVKKLEEALREISQSTLLQFRDIAAAALETK